MESIRLMRFLFIVFFYINLTANAQTEKAKLSTDNIPELKSGNEESKVIENLAELFRRSLFNIYGPAPDAYNLPHVLPYWGTKRNIKILEDRIEYSRKDENVIVYFSDISDYKITYSVDNENDGRLRFGGFQFVIYSKGDGKKMFDDLVLIQKQEQNHLIDKQKSQLILFEPIAAQYRDLKVKPPVSEAQRKYIIQANSFNELKSFVKAIEMYNKAIEVDQTAYPAAYSNLALLSAQLGSFINAIYYMQKYLLLEPEAADARVAQDKIYEWEAQLGK